MWIKASGPLLSQRLDYFGLVKQRKRIVTRADHPVVGDWAWFGFPAGVDLTPGDCDFGFSHVYKEWGSRIYVGDGHYVRWANDVLTVDGVVVDTGRSCWFTLTNVLCGVYVDSGELGRARDVLGRRAGGGRLLLTGLLAVFGFGWLF